ncbi:MAG: hypothetical protein ACXABY_06470 [Candidatus Thorarchaeota archaeon]|jgi:hypothetical protein
MITRTEIEELGWKFSSESKLLMSSYYTYKDKLHRMTVRGRQFVITSFAGRSGLSDIEHIIFNGALQNASDLKMVMFYLKIPDDE